MRRQEPFIVAPAFDEGETARLARRVCQSVDDILCVCVWSTNGSQLENKQKAGQLGRANQKEKRISISLFFPFILFYRPGTLSGRRRRTRRAGYPLPRLSIP